MPSAGQPGIMGKIIGTDRTDLLLGSIALLACILAFAFSFQSDLIQVGDASYYLMLGISLAQGKGLSDISMPDAPPKLWWPIGFPATIAVFFLIFGPQWVFLKILIFILLYVSLFYFAKIVLQKKSEGEFDKEVFDRNN